MRDEKGKKHANDGAYKLARNLFAYYLNQAVDATYCDAMLDIEASAKELLAYLEFDGSGSYLDPNDELYSWAVALAACLDAYNNMGHNEWDCTTLYNEMMIILGPETEPVLDFGDDCGPIYAESKTSENILTTISGYPAVDIEFNAYPNPFRHKANFKVRALQTTTLKIEVLTLTGQYLETIFEGEIDANTEYNFEFNGNKYHYSSFAVRVTSENGIGSMQLIKVK